MTFGASKLPGSAVELYDDDGQPAATIYATRSGIEIVAAPAIALESAADVDGQRASITLTPATEDRRR